MKSEIIKNRERAAQMLAFDGLTYGKSGRLRPTDIDLSIDWQGRSFVFVEVKGNYMPLTPGQQYHLQGLVNGLRKAELSAIAIHVNHDTPDVDHDIFVKDCVVVQFYDGKRRGWVKPSKKTTLEEFMQDLYEKHEAGGF